MARASADLRPDAGLPLTVATDFPGLGRGPPTTSSRRSPTSTRGGDHLPESLVETGEAGASTGGLVRRLEPRTVDARVPAGRDDCGEAHAGGVSVALDALMRERGGVCSAHGAGSADRVVWMKTHRGRAVEAPAYGSGDLVERRGGRWVLRRLLEHALWPLCHQAHVRPQFRAEDGDIYQSVNRKFAEIVATDAPPDSSVFLNDYHLTLVAQYLRERRPRLRTAIFWHIPWPDVDVCASAHGGAAARRLDVERPGRVFQLPRDQRNFLNCVQEELSASVAGETVYFGDRHVRVVSGRSGRTSIASRKSWKIRSCRSRWTG